MILSWFSGFCFKNPGYDKIHRVACSWKMSPFDTPNVAEVDFSQEVESLPWFVFVLITVHLGYAFLSLPPLCLCSCVFFLFFIFLFYGMCSVLLPTVSCFSFQSSVAFCAISVISFPLKRFTLWTMQLSIWNQFRTACSLLWVGFHVLVTFVIKVCALFLYFLSLIHISEPTRPP